MAVDTVWVWQLKKPNFDATVRKLLWFSAVFDGCTDKPCFGQVKSGPTQPRPE
jgi:hypothetical protein